MIAKFLFPQVSPARADFLRIAVYGTSFIFWALRNESGYAHLPPEMWDPIVPGLLDSIRPPFPLYSVCRFVWLLALALSAIGFLSPLAKAGGFVGYCMIGLYPSQFGVPFGAGAPLFFLYLYLCFFPCSNRYAFDAALFKFKPREVVEAWPVKCFQIFLVFLYTTTGIQKLRLSPSEWIDGSYLSYFLQPQSALGNYPFLIIAASLGVIVLEFSSVFLFTRARYFILCGLFGLHIAVHYLLGLPFHGWTISLLTFFFV